MIMAGFGKIIYILNKATIIILKFKEGREGVHATSFKRKHRDDRLGINKSHMGGDKILYENKYEFYRNKI